MRQLKFVKLPPTSKKRDMETIPKKSKNKSSQNGFALRRNVPRPRGFLTHPIIPKSHMTKNPKIRKKQKSYFPGMVWNGSRMVRNGLEWPSMALYIPIFPYISYISPYNS